MPRGGLVAALATLAMIEAAIGVALVFAASTVTEYAGAGILISGGVAGIAALAKKILSDTTISHQYQDLITGLQQDNERLRGRLRECEERQYGKGTP